MILTKVRQISRIPDVNFNHRKLGLLIKQKKNLDVNLKSEKGGKKDSLNL